MKKIICSALFLLMILYIGSSSIFAEKKLKGKKESSNLKLKKETKNPMRIKVSVDEQKLYLYSNDSIISQYPVSTSKFGIGSEKGSYKTPLGKHQVVEKIGAGAPINTIFKSRINTKKTAQINYSSVSDNKDLVTSRILWLEGIEEGINKGKGIDSYLRHIYIHGTSDEGLIGKPASHGCIRMKNEDVVELFEKIPLGTSVDIQLK